MGDLFKLVVDTLSVFWPFRLVHDWEAGLYYACGRCVGVVGPGVKLVVPWFCDVVPVSLVPDVFLTPLKSVTNREGRQVSYSCSVTFRVTDPRAAYRKLTDYKESVIEIVNGVLSDGVRQTTDLTGSLLEPLRVSINHALEPYGLTVDALRLDNFVVDAPTLRLLQNSQESSR